MEWDGVMEKFWFHRLRKALLYLVIRIVIIYCLLLLFLGYFFSANFQVFLPFQCSEPGAWFIASFSCLLVAFLAILVFTFSLMTHLL